MHVCSLCIVILSFVETNDILKTLGYFAKTIFIIKLLRVQSFADRPTRTGGGERESLTARDGSSSREAWARSRVTALPRARNRTRSSLVDPASSHMLVSKIKPCMSQCMPN